MNHIHEIEYRDTDEGKIGDVYVDADADADADADRQRAEGTDESEDGKG